MPRPLRFLVPGCLVEVTNRTFQGRLLLRPSKRLNEIFLGALGRAQRQHEMEIVAAVCLSSHFHLLLRPRDAEQLAGFMRDFTTNLTKKVNGMTGWSGTIFNRRYSAIVVSDEDAAMIARLEYLLSNYTRLAPSSGWRAGRRAGCGAVIGRYDRRSATGTASPPSTHPTAGASALTQPTWRELALLAAALVVGSGLVEGALRLHYQAHRRGSLADLADASPPPAGKRVGLGALLRVAADRDQVYELRSRLDVRFKGVRVVTGEHGWREEEHALAKPAGTRRVVGLGDSVMFGWGVAVEERYLDVLERSLARRRPEVDWQTWALAVPGYDLASLVAVLEGFGAELDPELVIYGWLPNDQCLPSFVVPEPSPWSWTSFTALYLRGAVGPPALVSRQEVVRPPGGETPRALDETYCFPDQVPPAFRDRVGPAAAAAGFARLARFAREHDVPVVVMKYNHDTFGAFPQPLPDGLVAVDLQPLHDRALRADPGRGSALYLSPSDLHPSPAAHRLLARGLVAELERRGILEGVVVER